jgi:hypothetical protein
VLDVAYPLADSAADNSDTVTMVPVYRGNVVKPAEATLQPEVSWASRTPEDLWCLVMTGLDTHLTQVRTDSKLEFFTYNLIQGCGSGSQLDPDSIGSVDPDPDPGGQKWPTKVGKNLKISCFELLDVLF